MPGFTVYVDGKESLGPSVDDGGVDSNVDAYYTFTWTVDQLFEEVLRGDNEKRAMVHLKDATLPTFSVNKEQVKGASIEYKFAGSVSYDDVKLTWYDTLGLLKIVQGWRKRVWTAEGGLGYANDYKKKSIIISSLPYEPKMANTSNQWELINSWPSAIRHGELSYTQSDIKIVEVTLTYDWAEEKSMEDVLAGK